MKKSLTKTEKQLLYIQHQLSALVQYYGYFKGTNEYDFRTDPHIPFWDKGLYVRYLNLINKYEDQLQGGK